MCLPIGFHKEIYGILGERNLNSLKEERQNSGCSILTPNFLHFPMAKFVGKSGSM